tara:strand:+ start:67 stop:570 length:504 start_codon:yes stop_codon:yes gene_type:complete
MLIIKKILGNIYNDTVLNKKIEDLQVNASLQKLFLTRSEMEKIHLRKETNGGIEVGLTFEAGTKFHHGDVLNDDSLWILINQIPENTIKISLKNDTSLDMAVIIGHVIGNRHRPISINSDHSISFPIHDNSELDLFRNLFQESIDNLVLSVEETIFVPNAIMNVHEH